MLSSSILNKLYPGNAIFQQQLVKMKRAKENFTVERKPKKTRRRSRLLLSKSSFSGKKIPDLSTLSECKSGIAKDVVKLNDNFRTIKRNLRNISTAEGRKRPTGGKSYVHIKPRYNMAKNFYKGSKELQNRLVNFTRTRRKERPTSACSSPTKMGRENDSMEEVGIFDVENALSGTKIQPESEVPMREVKDYQNLPIDNSRSEY